MRKSVMFGGLALALLPLLAGSAHAARSGSSSPASISSNCLLPHTALTVGGSAFFDLTDYTIANASGSTELVTFSFGGFTVLTVVVPDGSTATQAFATPIRLSSPSGPADLVTSCSVASGSAQVTFSGVFVTP